MNLLKETKQILKDNKLKEKDILWGGTTELYETWETFKHVIDIDYDDGYGGQNINRTLILVGKDWWLERHEYDGSEWWEFKRMPKQPKIKGIPTIYEGL